MDITWNVKGFTGEKMTLDYAISCIRAGEYKASCSAAKMSLPEKIVAYRKMKPVFDAIRAIYKQIEGAYGLDREALEYVQTELRRELAVIVNRHFTIAPRRGYSVVTFVPSEE